jgi:hypothetical protein
MLSRLYTLLLVLVIIASAWVAFGIGALVICALIFTLALFIARCWSLTLYFILVTVCMLIIALLMPAVACSRNAALRWQCTNNLKQIGLALLNYDETYKCFPPAYIADKNGKPIHSWRVLILPFLECDPVGKLLEF